MKYYSCWLKNVDENKNKIIDFKKLSEAKIFIESLHTNSKDKNDEHYQTRSVEVFHITKDADGTLEYKKVDINNDA